MVGTANAIAGLAPYEIRRGVQDRYEDLKRLWTEATRKMPRKITAQEL
jgi:hypothetical protein